jgi:hypothetical protein
MLDTPRPTARAATIVIAAPSPTRAGAASASAPAPPAATGSSRGAAARCATTTTPSAATAARHLPERDVRRLPRRRRSPAAGTTATAKSQLEIRNTGNPTKSQLQWKWGSGAATTLAEFGNPGSTDDPPLCVYDNGDPHLPRLGSQAWRHLQRQAVLEAQPQGLPIQEQDAGADGIQQLAQVRGLGKPRSRSRPRVRCSRCPTLPLNGTRSPFNSRRSRRSGLLASRLPYAVHQERRRDVQRQTD